MRASERVSAEGTFNLPAAASFDAFNGRCGGRTKLGPTATLFIRFIGLEPFGSAAASAAALATILALLKEAETLAACAPSANGEPMAAK
jgi:hypothetical protein